MLRLAQFYRALRLATLVSTALYLLALCLYLVLRVLTADTFWWLSFLNTFALYLFLPLVIMLPAALLLRARRISLMAGILLAVGLIWVGPYFLPKAARASSGSAFKVVTFNIWGGNTSLDQVEAWLRQTNADVVLIQEIPGAYADSGIAALRDLYPYQEAAWPWGNLLLSRHAIEPSGASPPQPDSALPQQRIVITTSSGRIVIYNVHYSFPFRPQPRFTFWQNQPFFVSMPLAFDDRPRNHEITAAVKLLAEEREPFIFGGDFNVNATAPTYDLIARYARDSFREVGMGLGMTWPVAKITSMPAFVPPLIRIDYIWHSPHFCATRAELGPELGSDHLPLVVTLERCGS